MSAPTWEETVEEFISDQLGLYDVDAEEGWRQATKNCAENAMPAEAPVTGSELLDAWFEYLDGNDVQQASLKNFGVWLCNREDA